MMEKGGIPGQKTCHAPFGMGGEEQTYAEKAAWQHRRHLSAARRYSFDTEIYQMLLNNNMPKGEEIYVSLLKLMDTKLIGGVQKVRGCPD